MPGSTVGSYPNAITMPNSTTILVSIGRDNALAEYRYAGPRTPAKYLGLLPTDFYPVAAQYDAAIGKVVVTNDKGIGARGAPSTIVEKGGDTSPAPAAVTGHNTSTTPVPSRHLRCPAPSALGTATHQVFVTTTGRSCSPKDRPRARPPSHRLRSRRTSAIRRRSRCVPDRQGEIAPTTRFSVISARATVTPASRSSAPRSPRTSTAIANSYDLMDNFYDEGTLSADGHNWLMQADANDYIERSRRVLCSYPAQGGDALAYQRDGFLWNAAENAGNTVAAYGEYNNFLNEPAPAPSWSDYYRDSQILEGKAKGQLPVPPTAVNTYSDIPSLNAIDDHQYPAFDLAIPDSTARTSGSSPSTSSEVRKLPNLNLIWMPDDHTAGVGSGDPAPVAEVADNDLAVGRMISSISHSKYWSSSAVFVLEDDTQNGADHVDGHRGPLLVASPYARTHAVVDTYYTQLNLVRTIEQILDIAPMNQEDRAAEPMFDAFTNTATTAPYVTIANKIPLTYGLTSTATGSASASARSSTAASRTYRPASAASQGVPAAERRVYDAWAAWSRGARFNGSRALVDWANPAQLGRLDWYSAHNWTVPYPGDARILSPLEVPGRNLPNGYLGDN